MQEDEKAILDQELMKEITRETLRYDKIVRSNVTTKIFGKFSNSNARYTRNEVKDEDLEKYKRILQDITSQSNNNNHEKEVEILLLQKEMELIKSIEEMLPKLTREDGTPMTRSNNRDFTSNLIEKISYFLQSK